MENSYYQVKTVNRPIHSKVIVPGSKSITNRALLLASLAKGESILNNVLFSDDSRHFIQCVKALGYQITVEEEKRRVRIFGASPTDRGEIYVGSAGTAARFLTAMLAAFPGEYVIGASKQMQVRPMKPLCDALSTLGAELTYLGEEFHLPLIMKGKQLKGGSILLDSGHSSQFLSALLMTGCLHENGLVIKQAGKEIAKSYIGITLRMIEEFGGCAYQDKDASYVVKAGNRYQARVYEIEPDVSAACYFYALAVLTGGSALVRGVHLSSMQGDIQFLKVLQELGAVIRETEEGVLVTGPKDGIYEGIDIDLNDCSDQTMTLAALAVFAATPTTIRNIEHIKYQESNRVFAIITELNKMGIKSHEIEDGIVIYPGSPKPALIETYQDHRMAMAFALIGLRAEGIRIGNPSCCSKTFETYFEVLDEVVSSI